MVIENDGNLAVDVLTGKSFPNPGAFCIHRQADFYVAHVIIILAGINDYATAQC